MRLGAFFSVPIVVLAITPTQIAATTVPGFTTNPIPNAENSTPQNTAIVQSAVLIAQRSRQERIRFAPGANSATIQTSVIRGTRDTFLVAAKRRQRLSVNITSLEKNAVFDIQGPNGELLKQEATSWSGVLPATGDYRVIVGGTRGNASYRLRVSVK